MLNWVKGRFGATVSARLLGQEDAVKLFPALHPNFNSLDIAGLPNWQGYVRLQINNEPTPSFSFRTQKDETHYYKQLAAKRINMSRFVYGTNHKIVDDRILRRRSLWEGTFLTYFCG